MRLIIIGGPAAGKSTLTANLTRLFPRVETFGVRRHFAAQVAAGTDIGRQSAPYVRANAWIPDEIVVAALGAEIDARLGDSFILEGVPASAGQAALLDQVLAARGMPLDRVVHVSVSEEVAVARARRRLVCFRCDGGSHQARFDAEGRCRTCGEEVSNRPSDRGSSLRERLDLHRRHLPPLLAHYGSARVLDLDGARDPSELLEETLRALDCEPQDSHG